MTEVERHVDDEARRFYAADPAPDGLASARLAVEHVTHHGQPLRHSGSSYAETTTHRFRCRDDRCPFAVAWSVTE